jgi:anti-sigma factor RsiW
MTAEGLREEHLHAYVDRQLGIARAQQVEAWLVAVPDAAAAVAAYREQGALLHAAFDGVLDEPLPERLLRRPRMRPLLPRLVTALSLLLVGGVIGWFVRDASEPTVPNGWPRHAAAAHAVFVPELRHPVEVHATEEAHLVGWLSKRLGQAIDAPKLSAHGFALLGGRLLPESQRPGAQFMYQDSGGRRLTLYLSTDVANRDSAFRYTREGDVHVFYWIDREVGYALSGELRKEEMLQIARTLYEQVNP